MSSFRFKAPSKPSTDRGEGAQTVAPATPSPGRAPRFGAESAGDRPEARSTGRRSWLDEKEEAESLIRFACEPGSNLLEDVHQFVEAYAKLRFRPSVAQRVSLAAYELFSNALNYGSVSSEVVFELLEQGGLVQVRVQNDAIRARLEMLGDRVKRLERDPEATFVEEMRRYVSGGVSRAMLGLARVRHEGQMELALAIEDSRVVVTASCAR